MKHRSRFAVVVLFIVLMGVATLDSLAQAFVVPRLVTTAYPTMTAECYNFDAQGAFVALGAKEVTVKENGANMTVTTTCGNGQSTPASIMVAVDRSSETLTKTKAGAASVISGVVGQTDELGLISFNQAPSLEQGLTVNKTQYAARVSAITAGTNGTAINIDSLFHNAPLGAFAQLKNARNFRALVIFVSGSPSFDAALARKVAKQYAIKVYVVGIGLPISAQLRELCDSTGGAWIDGLTSDDDIKAYAWAFVAHARGVQPCEAVWTSTPSCALERTIDVKHASTTRSFTIPAPIGSRIVLELSEPGIAFGEVAPPQTVTKSVVLTVRNGFARVTAYTSSNPRFAVTLPTGPVDMIPGASQEVKVRFTPTDSSGQFGTITFVSADACDTTVLYVRGGFRNKDNNLKVLSPNGGEKYVAGIDTLIRWTGTLPQDIVRIDGSEDDGVTWSSITEAASGNEYVYTPGPNATKKALIRIQRTLLDPSDIIVLSGSEKPIYAAALSNDSKTAYTGGHDGTVRVWDAETGLQRRVMTGHSDWVWGLAVHPSANMIASASHDGTVRFWDPTAGTQLGAVPVTGRAWTVAFNANGDSLYVSTDAGIVIIDPASFTIVQNVPTTDGSIVYSVRVSQDGTQLVTCEGNTVRLREATGDLAIKRSFVGHVGPVYSADVNVNGQVVVSGGADLMLRRWDASNGTQTGSTPAMTGSLLSVQFNRGGGQVLTGSGDGTAKFFETNTLNELNALAGHTGLVYSARYNSTGDKVITASTDFTARVWNISGIRLDEDKSDAVFEILGSTVTTQDVEFTPAIEVGGSARQTAVVIRNTGATPIVVQGARFSTGDQGDFNIISPVFPVTVAPGATSSLTLTFQPTQVGDRSTTLLLQTGTGPRTLTVRGTGKLPVLNVISVIDYGRRIANLAQIDTNVRVALPIGVTSPVQVKSTAIVGPDQAQFSIVSGGAPFTVSNNGTQTIVVRFAPSQNGRAAADLVITSTDDRTVVVHLYGEGTGDARFQPVAPVVFPLDVCSSDPVAETFNVTNIGNSTLILYSGIIDGTDAVDYTLERVGAPLTFPIEVEASKSVQFRVIFAPKSTGAKSARVVFSSNAINASNGLTAVTLVGRKDSVAFELSRSSVTYADVAQGETPVETVYLINRGTIILRWPKTPIDLGDFVIEKITPDIVQPNQQSEVTIRFKGGKEGSVYTTSFVFTTQDTACGRRDTLQLTAFVNAVVSVTLRMDTIRSHTGATVSVPLYVTNKQHLDRTTVRSIHADLLVNASILQPSGSLPMGQLDSAGKIRRIPVVIPIPEGSDSLAMTLQFSTTWGNDTMSVINVANFTEIDTMRVLVRQGGVILDDLCTQGGVRLFQLQPNAAGIVASPQPATGATVLDMEVVEKGMTTVELVDMQGRTLATLVQRSLAPGSYRVPMNVSQLPAGVYFLQMTTPTEHKSVRFERAK